MRVALVVALGLTVCGCYDPHPTSALNADDRARIAVNPAGRYQMVQTGPNTVAVLDTRYGSVKACVVNPSPASVSCGMESGGR